MLTEKKIKASRSIQSKIETISKLKAEIKKLDAELKFNEKQVKQYLGENEVLVGDFDQELATFKEIISNIFQSKKFAEVHADLYENFKEPVISRKFLIKV